ncbi:MAG: PTS sugar transporter subunit IIA [Phycisphaerae bacterium]|nr:PTS sugar transporter subunit IIA [Phycisphaerae bacterium]
MPYRNMTLDQLARHMGMDARILRKWAEKGKLPGRMIGGEWRFNRAALLDWLQREMHSFDDEHIRSLERAMREAREGRLIGAYLATEAVEMTLPARTRASVLRELVRVAERTGLVYCAAEIVLALEDREALGSTALPRGIAFPHPLRPLTYATAEPLVCLARVPAGIPFGAPDGKLTDLFVLVCANDERLHLGLLARLAMMFNTDLPDALRQADDADEALQLMLETEAAVLRCD